MAFSSAAGAAITVDSTGDSGPCSLRFAIEAVEANSSGACGTVESPTTEIDLPANTITLSKQLVITKGNMAIVGDESNPASTIIKGGSERVLENAGGVVELVGVEITKGHTPDGGLAPGFYTENVVGNGGGILNKGHLTLDHSIVTENKTGQGDLGLNGGLEQAGGSGGRGGSGGGIFNEPGALLTIVHSTVSKNVTGNGGRGGDGGAGVNAFGHFPDGGDGGSGGGSGDGGGIYNAGTLTIEESTITENFTGRGGEGGTGHEGTGETVVEGHELSPGNGGDGGEGGNNGKAYSKNTGYMSEQLKGGGGIYNAGTLTMSDSTINGNGTGAGGTGGGSGPGGGPTKYGQFADSGRAGTGGGGGRGGGLFTGAGYGGYSVVHLTNVTIFGNRAGDGGTGGAGGGGEKSTLGGGVGGWGGDGGGIWSEGASGGSEAVLTHVTIAGNGIGAAGLSGSSANPNGNASGSERGKGAGIDTGGRYSPSGSAVYLKNSIVANNGSNIEGDANCFQAYYPTYVDIYDLGGNVTWNDTTCPGKVTDPKLGPLANNGGATLTLLPGAGSAIEAVAAANCAPEDQRGFQRPGPGKTNCDAGAVESDLHGGEVGEEKPKEEPPGGNPGGGNPGGGNPTPTPTPTKKPLKCKKGFVKKKVRGKPHCVKVKKKKHRQHKRQH